MTTGGKALRARAPRPEWHGHAWRMAALCALVAAAYSSSFQAGLVFDNSSVILGDARLRAATAENVGRIFSETYSKSSSGLYRPITTLSYLLNYSLFGNGTDAAGYHWVNLAIHAANVLLVYWLGIFVLEAWGPALAMAALWGVHPLLTESVTNIVGRADLLAALGVLAGLLCYIRAAAEPGRKRWMWVGGLAAAQIIGIFSKESAVVLPGLMLLCDVTGRARGSWGRRAAGYAASIVPLVVFAAVRARLPMRMAASNTDNPLLLSGFWTARLTAVHVIGKYLWLFVWPSRLSPDYSYNAIPVFAWRLEEVAALAVCAAAAVAAVWWYRTQKPLFFFLAFFAVALLPVSNLIVLIGSIMAERFVYLPSAGLAGLVAIACQKGKRAGWIAAAVVCAACAARTYARNFDWADERTLWTSAVEAVPESAKAHYNLGTALSDVPGQEAEAAAQLEAALRINPGLSDARENLARLKAHAGSALAQQPGRAADAIAAYQEALRIDPNFAEGHLNLGTLLLQSGRTADAIPQFEAALRINPNLVQAHNNLGIALAQTPDRMKDAAAEFQAALRIDPGNAEARGNLEKAAEALGGR